jgi:hypothetical protein
MTKVEAHYIVPFKLKLATENNTMIVVIVDKENNFELDFENFVPRLINLCKSVGIHMEQPLYRSSTMSILSRVENLRAQIESLNKEASDSKKLHGNLQLILCVMSKKDRGYNDLK